MSASQPALFNVQEFTDNGITLVGGRLYTYVFGTTTLLVAYTDPAGTVPQTYTADGLGGQYIALNSRGELPTPLYLGSGSYDISLKRADGSTVWTRKADGVDNFGKQILLDLAAPGGASQVGFDVATIAEYFKTSVGKVVDSIAAMKALDTTKFTRVFVTGYYASGDGGGGAYKYDAADITTPPNGGTVFLAIGPGRWKIAQGGLISNKQFGTVGDYVADDTDAWQRFLDYLTTGAAINQHKGYSQTGIYKITGAGLKVLVADTLPPMITDGAESVVLKGNIPITITFEVSGGSGQITTVEWAGFKIDGVTTSGNEGVRVNGLCFFTLKGWHFYNVSTAARMYNLKAGVFCEGVVFDNCYFHTSVLLCIWYSRGAGTTSFRSTGLHNCKCNLGPTSMLMLIDNGCTPYMGGLDVTVWNYRSDAVLIQNNSTQVPMIGNITLESFPETNKMTLVQGPGYIFLLGRILVWGTNSDKVFKGMLITCSEYFGTPDQGQMYLPDTTSGSIVTTGVGQTYSLKYLAGVHRPLQQDSAMLTITVTAPGYLWQAICLCISGATDNIINSTVLVNNLILNTAGYGAMNVSQGNAYNVILSNALTGSGTKCVYSFKYLHALLPQI